MRWLELIQSFQDGNSPNSTRQNTTSQIRRYSTERKQAASHSPFAHLPQHLQSFLSFHQEQEIPNRRHLEVYLRYHEQQQLEREIPNRHQMEVYLRYHEQRTEREKSKCRGFRTCWRSDSGSAHAEAVCRSGRRALDEPLQPMLASVTFDNGVGAIERIIASSILRGGYNLGT
jgi:hypothetical protein